MKYTHFIILIPCVTMDKLEFLLTKRTAVPVYWTATLSAASGLVTIPFIQPLDVIKTKLQVYTKGDIIM